MERKVINFWCARCRIDIKALAKRGRLNYHFLDIWQAKCPTCKAPIRRLVNDAARDWYFRLSRKTREESRRYAIDTLQVNDPRFDIFYPQHKKQRDEAHEQELQQDFMKRSANKSNLVL